ncbi:sugar ABC transporter permease [Demequina sp. NBRC 110053]|uniref:sugar ABC transporter permease n=1 Tax=Demequina sp. NBRC 110053 TaxID=1570342 RepID=UPI0009FD9425|nr:ABC transporter permease [Demequina sp. NBRC 110053]
MSGDSADVTSQSDVARTAARESDAPTLLGKGVENSPLEHGRAYLQRLRGGEMGALPAIGGLLVLFVIFHFANDLFTTPRNMANLITQAAPLVVLGMALVFVLLLGEIDLSAGVTFGVAMAVFVKYTQPDGLSWPVALLLSLGIGFTIGFVIGFFVARIGVPSFVVTLGLFLGLQGVILMIIGAGGTYRLIPEPIKAIQNSNLAPWEGWALLALVLAILVGVAMWDRVRRSRAGAPNPSIWIPMVKLIAIAAVGVAFVLFLNIDRGGVNRAIQGVPIVVPFVLAIGMVGTYVLDRTRFGRYMYAIGGNREAARRSGVNVTLIKWSAFVICSSLAVVAGLLFVSRVGSADASTGREIVLSGVAAAVVGGVSLFGGRGRLMHAAVGALVIATIENGLGLLGFSAGATLAVSGGVLILAATVDALARRRSGAVT